MQKNNMFLNGLCEKWLINSGPTLVFYA